MAEYTYKMLGLELDEDNWESLNDNFKTIARDLSNLSGDVLASVIDGAKLTWQEPVDTFADLATVYPDAQEGWTVFVRNSGSNGETYRFNGSEWLLIQEFDGTAINEVESRLTSQLAEKVSQAEALTLLGGISDGTPLFAPDTAGMTDTTRNYVNTTDGLLYTHNGTAWVSTGVTYQATGIADGTITQSKVETGLANRVAQGNYFVLGELTKAEVNTITFNGVFSTPSTIIIGDAAGKYWSFEKMTDYAVGFDQFVYADLTLAPYNSTPHPLTVTNNVRGTWQSNTSRVLLLANYYGRLSGRLAVPAALFSDVKRMDTDVKRIGTDVDALKSQATTCFFEKNGDSMYMYKPSKGNPSRYFKMGYRRDLNAEINADVWRMFGAWIVTRGGNAFTTQWEIHNTTEWEGVLREQGKSDFMGGWHGDETTRWIDVWVDDVKIDMTQNQALRTCKKIEIVSSTTLNRMDTPTDVLMERTKRFTFDADKMTVDNRFKTLVGFTIAEFYPTMLGVHKQDWSFNSGAIVVDKGMKDDQYKAHDCNDVTANNILSTPSAGVKVMKLYSATNQINMTATCIADKTDYPNQQAFIQTTPYPKMYFTLAGNYATTPGEIFRAKSIYEIEI